MPDEPREETEEELERRLRKLLGEAEDADAAELDELELKLQDVEGKLASQTESRQTQDELFDSEFSDRLKRLHDKADTVRTKREASATQKKRSQNASREDAQGLGVGLAIAYTVIGAPLLGVGVGWLIDRSLGTSSAKGIGMLVGAVIGVAMAAVMMAKMNRP